MMMRKIFNLAVLSISTYSFLLFCMAANADTLRRIQVDVEQAGVVAQKFIQSGHDVLENTIREDSFEIIVSSEQLKQLIAKKYNVTELERGRPFNQHHEAVAGPDLQTVLNENSLLSAPPSGYKDLTAVLQDMRAIAQANPAIATFVDITQQFRASTTVEGRHIYALKISDNVNADENEPTALIVSNHHARELVTPELALYAMHQLVEQYATDPAVAAVVNANEIWIVPVWNPDGYNYVFTGDNMWRKNRRVFSSGTGVDLNRNYPTGWSTSCGGSTNTRSNTYRGPDAASEAETSTMIKLSEDRHFFKVIDFHSSGRETLYSYPSRCGNHPFQNWLVQRAEGISDDMGYGGRVRTPSAFGEHFQWQLARGAHAFLVETARSFQPSYSSARSEARQVWPGILKFLQRDVPLSGTVTDAATGSVIAEASIELPGVNFSHGEVNSSNAYGRYQVYAPAGQRTVRFSAPGYISQDVSAILTGAAGTTLNIQLVK